MSLKPYSYQRPFNQDTFEYFKNFGEEEVNEKRDELRRLAIHVAAADGNNSPEVKRLLSIGADINSKDKVDNTSLHYAATFSRGDSHFDIIKMLIESGANVNSQSQNGTTPLYCLIRKFSVKTVNLLLDFGADVNLKDKLGETPLSREINLKNENNLDVLKLLLDRGSDVNNSKNENITPLQHACASNSYKHVKLLVKSGAQVNAFDPKGRTPLMMYVESFDPASDLVRFLIKFFDVNIVDILEQSVLSYLNDVSKKSTWKTVLEHIAKLLALDLPVDQSLKKTISNQSEFQEYFDKCTEQLKMAISTKLKNCWVSYFNLLFDSKRKLKNYAGNQNLIQDFKNSDCSKEFPIYGAEMTKKVDKGIETRKSFDKSTFKLSYCLPVFDPTHLIIKDVLDCLTFQDYNQLTSEKF